MLLILRKECVDAEKLIFSIYSILLYFQRLHPDIFVCFAYSKDKPKPDIGTWVQKYVMLCTIHNLEFTPSKS